MPLSPQSTTARAPTLAIDSAAPRALERLLETHPAIRRGHERATRGRTIPSGYAAPDAVLPGNGWAVGGVTEPKYGGTRYTLAPDEREGQFCGVFPYAEHVQLAFTRGDRLDDPAGMLDGKGKRRRHLKFGDVDDIPDGDVRAFVRQASRAA